NGEVRVHRVVVAIDPGHVVNPLSVEMQVQGAVVYALTAALYGEITIKDGAAEQTNFDAYEMLQLADAPKVETVMVPSGGFWGGRGGGFGGRGRGTRGCRRWRRLCVTRFSPPPESACARCR